ncbi:hypothetical protein KGF54_004921 [Candida jiufengensis]|uniref:uncharacterized protein n=1 Tax=Candida jiufengensis TaxID=497108 RepID=UPI00222491D1|nr:uncharacterized protein KGF54_004921 [Candida jiufengensis]KAI5951846.1 hypothetical protein KGF54_004921 [Candida jiufengensis]
MYKFLQSRFLTNSVLKQRPILLPSIRIARQFNSSPPISKLFGKSKHSNDPIKKNQIKLNNQPISASTEDNTNSAVIDNTAPTKGVTEHDFKTHPILKRVPKFLRNYASKFVNAPFSSLVAFIILHEITAIVPLIGIWYYIHQHPGFIPLDLPQWAISKGAKVMDSMMGKFDWNLNTADKFSVIVEGAYAFTIVKFLLPIRVVISLYFMPWFARWFILPITNIFSNMKEIRKAKKEQGKITSGKDQNVELKKVEKPRL